MKRLFAVLVLTVAVSVGLTAIAAERSQDDSKQALVKPAAALDVMSAAYRKSRREKKPMLLIFHATWCGWCKRLQAVMDVPEIKKTFESNYVIVHLDVQERPEKRDAFENPGGLKLMADLGGEKSGLPYYAFLDSSGKKLVDSNAMPNNMNIGYPGEKGEIAAFAKLLKDTAPHLSAAELDKLVAYLQEHAPAPNH